MQSELAGLQDLARGLVSENVGLRRLAIDTIARKAGFYGTGAGAAAYNLVQGRNLAKQVLINFFAQATYHDVPTPALATFLGIPIASDGQYAPPTSPAPDPIPVTSVPWNQTPANDPAPNTAGFDLGAFFESPVALVALGLVAFAFMSPRR